MTTTPLPITDHDHTDRCWWHPLEARWVCVRLTPEPEPADPADPADLVDTRDMLVVHTALLREFRLAPRAVRRVADGDVRAARTVDRHLGFVCDLLHHHHEGEDELLWPLLRDRVPAAGLTVMTGVESQHEGIGRCLDDVAAAREQWVEQPGGAGTETLAAALETLFAALEAHLELEETAVLPLAATLLQQSEWDAVGEAAAAAMPKPDLLLAFGMFAYEGDRAVLRRMLSSAPAPARVLVPRLAPRSYAKRARAVYGTPTP